MTPTRVEIRDLRKARKWSQATLAEKAGAAVSTISDIERGGTSRIELELLERLARALGVEPGELIVRAPRKRAQ